VADSPTLRNSPVSQFGLWRACCTEGPATYDAVAVDGSLRKPLRAIDHREQYLRARFGGPGLEAVEPLLVI